MRVRVTNGEWGRDGDRGVKITREQGTGGQRDRVLR